MRRTMTTRTRRMFRRCTRARAIGRRGCKRSGRRSGRLPGRCDTRVTIYRALARVRMSFRKCAEVSSKRERCWIAHGGMWYRRRIWRSIEDLCGLHLAEDEVCCIPVRRRLAIATRLRTIAEARVHLEVRCGMIITPERKTRRKLRRQTGRLRLPQRERTEKSKRKRLHLSD